MSKRNIIQYKRKNKEIITSNKPFVIGFGIIMVLLFFWGQFSNIGNIKESELIEIKGKLNSELIKKYSAGAKFWIFFLKDQPVKFSIDGIAKGIFNSKIFKSKETNESEITVKINKEKYEKSIKESKNKTIEIKYLSSNNGIYFDLNDFNEGRKAEKKFSYLFLILGIGGITYGLGMKK